MKKSAWVWLIVLALILITLMFGCSQAYSLSFVEESFSVMPETTFQPKIKITPRKSEYTLYSSNPKIARVDGKSITTLKEGIVTISVQSGDKKDVARLVVINDEQYTNDIPIILPDYKRINFVVDDSAYFSPMEVQKGMTPGFPGTINPVGYTIDGWYADKTYTTKFDFNAPLMDNTVVFGKSVMSEPKYIYEEIAGRTFIASLAYPKVPYTALVLPTTTSYGSAITGIKEGAFKDNKTLTTVTIPSAYTHIEKQAFSACTNLESVFFEENSSLTKIGTSAFNGCINLKTFVLPSSLTELKGFAFNNCPALDIQSLPSGISILEDYVFAKTATVNIDLENITQIRKNAFEDCTKLESVFNTHKVTKCYLEAFNNTLIYATSVRDTGVAYIGTMLVGAKSGLSSFKLAEGTTLISDGALISATLKDTIITIPASPPKYIGSNAILSTISFIFDQAFYYISRISTETDPSNHWYDYRSQVCIQVEENDFTLLRYESSGNYSYSIHRYSGDAVHLNVKTALPSYTIKNILPGAFVNTKTFTLSLKTLTLGDVDTISDFAISNNIPTLLAIIMDTTKVPTLTSAMSIPKSNDYLKVYVPKSQIGTYKGNWSAIKSIIHSDSIVTDSLAISAIKGSDVNYVIQYFGDENSLIIPDDITFYDEIESNVPLTIISENAFRHNSTLERLVLGKYITEIREAALANTKLKTLEFLSEKPPQLDIYFLYQVESAKTIEKIYVPNGCADAYQAVIKPKFHSIIVER